MACNNVCKKKLGLEIFSYSTVRKEDEKEKCEDLKSFWGKFMRKGYEVN